MMYSWLFADHLWWNVSSSHLTCFPHAHHIWRGTALEVSALTSQPKALVPNWLCHESGTWIEDQAGLFVSSSTECGVYLSFLYSFPFCVHGKRTKERNEGTTNHSLKKRQSSGRSEKKMHISDLQLFALVSTLTHKCSITKGYFLVTAEANVGRILLI